MCRADTITSPLPISVPRSPCLPVSLSPSPSAFAQTVFYAASVKWVLDNSNHSTKSMHWMAEHSFQLTSARALGFSNFFRLRLELELECSAAFHFIAIALQFIDTTRYPSLSACVCVCVWIIFYKFFYYMLAKTHKSGQLQWPHRAMDTFRNEANVASTLKEPMKSWQIYCVSIYYTCLSISTYT